MTNKERALSLLNQIIEIETIADKESKTQALANGKSELSIGKSWRLFYLENLRELLINEELANKSERGAYDNKIA